MYGIIQTLLKEYDVEDTVLIESLFQERTRLGVYCDTVLLAITPDKLIIATENKNCENRRKLLKNYGDLNSENFELHSICPLQSVIVAVFKRTQRQMLKVVFNDTVTRYFELGKMPARNIFWKLWCRHVSEIRKGLSLWPYVLAKASPPRVQNTLRWTDKYVYLGPQRHDEDQIRPVPIPGLGPTNEIKLLYFKPEFFSCWDQGSHWVQCDEERETTTHDYDVYTYTGIPTSNITYTSLVTTVGIIGQF